MLGIVYCIGSKVPCPALADTDPSMHGHKACALHRNLCALLG